MPYNVQYDLRGQRVEDTFQQLLQYDTSSNLAYDGKGNQTNIIATTASYLSGSISNAVSSSYALTASFALNGGGSGTTLTTASTYQVTSSWANNSKTTTSSSWASSSISSSFSNNTISSSYAVTASFALNGGGGSGTTLVTASTYQITSSWALNAVTYSFVTQSVLSYMSYISDPTSSTNWITASFNSPNQNVILTNNGTYNFTHSNMPSVGQVADIIMFITNSSIGISSLNFPSNWQNIGPGWPSSISTGDIAVLWLRAIDSNKVIGTFNSSGSIYSASFSISSSYSLTSSFALNGGGGGTSLTTGSTYPITSSWAVNTIYPKTYLIPSGSLSASVTGLSFSTVPIGILCSVCMPTSNSLLLYASVDSSSLSTTSFTVYFNGTTDTTGYTLIYYPSF